MLYIRTDINPVIATGHLMRCLAIADAAKLAGEETTFIFADSQGVSMAEDKGYHAIVLHTEWDDMEAELPVLKKLLIKEKIQTLFIDSYQVTAEYLRQLSVMVSTVYLDDLNQFLYPVHALICYAAYWKKFDYESRYSNTKLYLGTDYIPLRQEFCHCEKKEIKSKVENLLLLSGGTDHDNILGGLLNRLDLQKYRQIHVVCGRYNTNYDALAEKYEDCGWVHIHKAVKDMAGYMQKADLAVSAGGTTLYELCACGTPTISYVLADNQRDNTIEFQQNEMIDCAGDVRSEDVVGNMIRLLDQYWDHAALRMERSEKMQSFVDGKGAQRIAAVLRADTEQAVVEKEERK